VHLIRVYKESDQGKIRVFEAEIWNKNKISIFSNVKVLFVNQIQRL